MFCSQSVFVSLFLRRLLPKVIGTTKADVILSVLTPNKPSTIKKTNKKNTRADKQEYKHSNE